MPIPVRSRHTRVPRRQSERYLSNPINQMTMIPTNIILCRRLSSFKVISALLQTSPIMKAKVNGIHHKSFARFFEKNRGFQRQSLWKRSAERETPFLLTTGQEGGRLHSTRTEQEINPFFFLKTASGFQNLGFIKVLHLNWRNIVNNEWTFAFFVLVIEIGQVNNAPDITSKQFIVFTNISRMNVYVFNAEKQKICFVETNIVIGKNAFDLLAASFYFFFIFLPLSNAVPRVFPRNNYSCATCSTTIRT